MKTRYTADAFIAHGPTDECGDEILEKQVYKTFVGQNLDKVISDARKVSLYGEVYGVTMEEFHPDPGGFWTPVEWFNIN